MSAANANDEYVANELIVKIADGANYSDIITLRESVNATVKKTIEQLNLEVWNIQDELGFIDLIQSNRNIEYAEPNYIQRVIGMPDDARFDDLWGMHNTGQTGGTTDADIDAVEVTGGRLNVNNALMSNPNFSCSQVTEIPSTECEALVALYNSTDGDNWTNNSGWLETNTPCSWYKVTCSSGHVSEIDLGWNGYSNNLTGSIPSKLGNLSNLQTLSLSSNSLTGSIPSELGNLSNLGYLNLGSNSLTGSIPSELGNLSKLTTLKLYRNDLTGSIPSELSNLSNLQYLSLSSNSLTGSIPSELSNLSNLQTLSLSFNSLTGSIPSELGNLSNLQTLGLSSNSLTGSILSELGNLSNLQYLSLTSNSLTGSIPSELSNLSNLQYLSLSSNSLTGSIPSELSNLSNLQTLSLSFNSLTGSIPSELGNLNNLERLDLCDSSLTGSIPSELGNLSNLERLDLCDSSLTGSIPSELGNLSNLQTLGLSSNSLTGSIPSELGNLSNLRALSLYNNKLTGSIPSELGNLSNLLSLSLWSNSLTGSIPNELGNLSNLGYLYLHNNKLTGSIPSELGNLSNLTQLWLYSNSLTGSIPSELGNLSNLWEIFLSYNSLTGSIPSELGNLTNLKYLFLNSNQLCGEIPVELKNLSKIPLPDQYGDKLQLDNNHLTATDSELIAWLDSHNPGWETTQTPCPQQCKLQLTSATYSVAEDGRQKTITVTRTNSSDGAVSVEYATSDETATNPDDYTQSTGTLYWSDGDTNDKTFPVEIIDDSQQENDETLIVSLGNPTGGAQLGTPDTAAVTITDNDSFSCKKVTEIPKKECNALVALYGSTDGENWVDNTGWKMTNTPCNWYGVTCKKGSVRKLELSNNNLKGVISKKFFKLKKLKVLFLNNNQLSGKLSNSMMKLKKLTELDLNVNCLKTKVSKKLKKWLDELNPGWDETQTGCLY
jgi:Leucine-rich repeat (LRR) protein